MHKINVCFIIVWIKINSLFSNLDIFVCDFIIKNEMYNATIKVSIFSGPKFQWSLSMMQMQSQFYIQLKLNAFSKHRLLYKHQITLNQSHSLWIILHIMHSTILINEYWTTHNCILKVNWTFYFVCAFKCLKIHSI